MSRPLVRGVGSFLLALLAGCILTDDRSGDRVGDHGVARRECLALKRLATSPVTIASATASPFRCDGFSVGRAAFLCPSMLVWGVGEMGEELGIGLVELISCGQFQNCAYPMERFRMDVEDWGSFSSAPVPLAYRASAETNKAVVVTAELRKAIRQVDEQVLAACEKGDWKAAAKICRTNFFQTTDDLEMVRNGTRLALINWNAGDRIGAVVAMETVVAACENIGGGCEVIAIRVRNDLRDGKGPERFSVAEVTRLVGLRGLVYEAAKRVADRVRGSRP